MPTDDRAVDVDVLLSHAYNEALLSATRPTLYVSGHAHGLHGLLENAFGSGLSVNASICDGYYRPVQLPIVCDVVPKACRAAAAISAGG